jgi:hypothetical protein
MTVPSDGQVNARSAVISALCMLLCLSFTIGKVSAQVPPVMDALPSDRLFIAGITASIPGYDRMTDLEKVRALRRYVYQTTPVGIPLVPDEILDLPLRDTYAAFAKGGGVFCAGASIMLSRVYTAAGFSSWVYDFGDKKSFEGPTTHQTTLVEVGGEVILQDAYLNFEYADAQGKPIPFLDLISRIVDGAAPTAKAGAEDRPWLFSSRDEAENYVDPEAAKTCQETATGVNCRVTITLSRFLEVDSGIPDYVESIGWPRQMEYLLLYPLGLVSMYSDGVARAESLWDDLRRRVANRLKAHNFALLAGWPRSSEYLLVYPISQLAMYSGEVDRAERLLGTVKRKLRGAIEWKVGNPLKKAQAEGPVK